MARHGSGRRNGLSGRTKNWTQSCGSRTLTSKTAPGVRSAFPRIAATKSGQLMCYENRTTAKATDINRPEIVSVAHELSGLGSTRVVRFSASGWRRIDEPGDVATGPTDGEVSGRFEPLGTARAVDDGSGGAAGNVGAPVSTLPGAV